MRLCFLDRVSNYRGHLILIRRKVRGSYGWREVDVFWPSQLRRSLNPDSVKSFLPSLSTVGLIYGKNLCLEGILGLGYTDIVTMLFSLIPSPLGLYFCLLGLSSQFFSLILELLGFFQFLPENYYLLLGRSQLVIGLTKALPLILVLSLSALQSQVSTPPGLLLLGQLFS